MYGEGHSEFQHKCTLAWGGAKEVDSVHAATDLYTVKEKVKVIQWNTEFDFYFFLRDWQC